MSQVGVSLILPVRNQSRVAEFVQRVRAIAVEGLAVELIVVNHGSGDKTHQVCQALHEYIDLYRRQTACSREAAIRAGVACSLGEIVVILDSEVGYDPADYPNVLTPIITGRADVVFGTANGNPASGHAGFSIEVLDSVNLDADWEVGTSLFSRLTQAHWRALYLNPLFGCVDRTAARATLSQ